MLLLTINSLILYECIVVGSLGIAYFRLLVQKVMCFLKCHILLICCDIAVFCEY